MKLEQSFEVAAPLDRVWAALIDVEKVAPCLPGAEITGRNDDGTYNGSFRVKIGPTAAAYVGKLEMENVDEASHSATMQAAGTDRRGQGGAKATIASSVKEGAAGTSVVEVSTEYSITGRLARFGRGGMIEEIGNRLLTEFASALQAMLAGPGEYETFVAMPAVGAADAATGGAADAGGAGAKPKRKPRKDLAAAAEAVAAASQPVEPEPGVEDLPDLAVEAAAEEELSAIVPEASVESEPPRAEVPQPPTEPELLPPAPEPVPSEPAQPEVVPPAPEVVPPEPEVVPPEPEPAPEPPPPPPAPEPAPPPPAPEPPSPPAGSRAAANAGPRAATDRRRGAARRPGPGPHRHRGPHQEQPHPGGRAVGGAAVRAPSPPPAHLEPAAARERARDVDNEAVGALPDLGVDDAHDLDVGAPESVVLAAIALKAVAG